MIELKYDFNRSKFLKSAQRLCPCSMSIKYKGFIAAKFSCTWIEKYPKYIFAN